MTKFSKPFLTALLALSTITPAQAENMAFDGAYIGLLAGYSDSDVDAAFDFSPLALGSFSDSEQVDGLEAGAFLGYRHHFQNNFVLGAEIGGVFSNADGARSDVLVSNDRLSLEKEREFYISVKPGYALSENALIYAIGGYQAGKYELSWTDGANAVSADETFNGFHFGAGAEYKPLDNIAFRLEYKRHNYGEESYTTAGVGTEEYDIDEDVFRVGVSYAF